MSITFKPLADRVLIEPAPAEMKTASGIIIPDSAKEKPLKGKVVAAGSGKVDEPMTLKAGDEVLYGQYSGTEIKLDGGTYLIMREAAKPNVVIGKAVFEASQDTTKLQEQLKAGGEIEQVLADSLVVEEKTDKSEEVHGNLMRTIPITDEYVETIAPPKEPTLDESLPKEEQAALQTKQPTKRGRK